jgi:hypothetical protein
LANGTNINTSKVNNVWLSKAGIKTVCGHEQSEILAAIVRD